MTLQCRVVSPAYPGSHGSLPSIIGNRHDEQDTAMPLLYAQHKSVNVGQPIGMSQRVGYALQRPSWA